MTSAEPVVATVATAGKRTGGAHCTTRSLKAEARSRAHMSASCSPVSVTRRGERGWTGALALHLASLVVALCAFVSRGASQQTFKFGHLLTELKLFMISLVGNIHLYFNKPSCDESGLRPDGITGRAFIYRDRAKVKTLMMMLLIISRMRHMGYAAMRVDRRVLQQPYN